MNNGPDNFAFTLARIQWDIFGTLTFAGRIPRPAIAFATAFSHIRHAAKLSARPYSKLLLALRQEFGELNGRFHFHYLLGGTKVSNVITLSHQLARDWKVRTGAMAEIRPFDRSLAGAAYVAKCLGGADAYELNKFNLADSVTLSDSIFRVLRRMESMSTDTAASTGAKTEGRRVLHPTAQA